MESSAVKTRGIFPSECLEEIFLHLLFEDDLEECTLVCPSWNEHIGSSRSCMQHLWIICKEKSAHRLKDLKNVLLNTKRKYTHISISGVYSDEMREALFVNRRWTHIYSELRFKTVADYFDFLQIIQTSVKLLALDKEIVDRDFKPKTINIDLQFP